MKERPILFKGPMVRAILEGKKTQTRRLVKPQPAAEFDWCRVNSVGHWFHIEADRPQTVQHTVTCKLGTPGDRLWVRETYIRGGNGKPLYCADADRNQLGLAWENGFRMTPSIFMRRWESRITLEITGVRVERLNAITETDAISEGIRGWYNSGCSTPTSFMLGPDDKEKPFYDGRTGWHPSATAIDAYRRLWERINGAGAWRLNPWVWVIEFRRVSS